MPLNKNIMNLILLQLFTGFTIGSKVIFRNKVMTILDFKITTPFSKGLLRTTWKEPLHFTFICKNQYGFIDVVGSKAVKSIFEAGLSYTEIQNNI